MMSEPMREYGGSDFDLPRVCRGPCKREKGAHEFLAKDGKNYVQWCKDCRYARFLFLKAQKRAKRPPVPTVKELLTAAERAAYCAMGPCDWCSEAQDKLRKLQEEYTWTAVRKR